MLSQVSRLPLAGLRWARLSGLMAEAGYPEAAIPLNDRGAAFMQQAMGNERGRHHDHF